jgi:protein SCO1/2
MKVYPALFVCLTLWVCACTRQKSGETDVVTFPLKGEVVEVDTAAMRITIAHEAIPDYMEAMTMSFRVKDAALLNNVAEGDSVQATLAVSRAESWLATLGVTGRSPTPEVLTAGELQAQRLFKAGDHLPDVPFLDQEGKPVRFSQLRGKVIALTFIYTRCPLPDFCIRMSEHFAKIQNSLKSDPAFDGRWLLVTVSFDPVFDTPRAMKSYGKNYGADFDHWIFLTDPDTSGQNVLRLADGLDLTYKADEGPTISHNLRTVLLDQEGRIVEVIKSNEWKPEEVVGRMKELMKPVAG